MNRRSNAQDLNRHDPDNSHVIVTFTLTQQKFIPNNGPSTGSSDTPPSTPSTPNKVFSPKLNKQFDGEWVTVTSKFHFVDLAGNEMVRHNYYFIFFFYSKICVTVFFFFLHYRKKVASG